MKALFIAHNVNISGANKSFLSIIEKLSNDVEITVLVNARDGALISRLDTMNISHIYCRYSWWVAHSRNNWLKQIIRYGIDKKNYLLSVITNKLLQELTSESFDVVYTNTSTVNIGAIIAEKLGIPHVWHIREFGKEDFAFIPLTSKKYRIETMSKSFRIIVISEALKEKYARLVAKDKLIVVHNGFEIDKLTHKRWRHDLSKQINVLITGQVCPAKGQDTAIKAVNLLEKKGYPIKLYIAGTIDYSFVNPILKIYSDYSNWCTLLGNISNMYDLRNNMDIELVCSRSEAFGRVTLEAMLHSIPVIGSRAGGTPEVIKHKKNGLLFDYGNFKQLAENIEFLINNESEYYNIIDNAYTYARKFTIERTVCGVKEVLERAVKQE